MDDPDFPEDYKSKSQRKRDVEHLQALGGELLALPAARLAKMDLPEALRTAVLDWQRFTKHEAKRRQLQYIGRLMRDLDPAPIAEQLAALRGESAAAKAEFHALEHWRARLLAEDGALAEWVAQHPEADVQHLRNLIRNARRESELGKPPRSSRELFRCLREAMVQQEDLAPPPLED